MTWYTKVMEKEMLVVLILKVFIFLISRHYSMSFVMDLAECFNYFYFSICLVTILLLKTKYQYDSDD